MSRICGVTRRDLATINISPVERDFVSTVSNMLSDPEWLLPIVAAQPQYRTTYYPLTAAALLEDVWFDALANWIHREDPLKEIRKTQRGEPGAKGDYLFDAQPFSHKSGNGPQTTGVHWDALVAAGHASGSSWTSAVPVVYVASGYGHRTGEWATKGSIFAGTKNCRVAWPPPDRRPPGRVPALVRWEPTGASEILHLWEGWPDFGDVWQLVARQQAAGTPANEMELLWVTAKKGPGPGQQGMLKWTGRAGFYLFPADLLRNIPTGGNNRATTLEASTILGLMQSAADLGLWAPLPMWHAAYAPARPPDLYLAQRVEFDRRFSPAFRH